MNANNIKLVGDADALAPFPTIPLDGDGEATPAEGAFVSDDANEAVKLVTH